MKQFVVGNLTFGVTMTKWMFLRTMYDALYKFTHHHHLQKHATVLKQLHRQDVITT